MLFIVWEGGGSKGGGSKTSRDFMLQMKISISGPTIRTKGWGN